MFVSSNLNKDMSKKEAEKRVEKIKKLLQRLHGVSASDWD
jgi:hypothetical protein